MSARARKTLKSVAYTAIRDAIVAGELSPGRPISEAQLQRMLGIGRTPIREALQRLAAENLITLTPHKGAVVTTLSIEDCQDIFIIREALEGLAAALSATRLPEESLFSLQREYDRLASLPLGTAAEQMVTFGQQLHATIHKGSGSARLIRLLRFMSPEINRLGNYQLGAQGRVLQSFSEHGDIIAALRARNPDAAEAAMRRHVRASAETAITMLLGARPLVGVSGRLSLPWTHLLE